MNTTSKNDATARAGIYSWLSLAFSSPEDEGLPSEESFSWCRDAIGNVLRERSDGKDNELPERPAIDEDVLVEYARLFVGPFHVPAPPYGSVYLEPRSGVMGTSSREVVAFYADCGFDVVPARGVLPDHVTIELEFLGLLCGSEADALVEQDMAAAREWRNRQRTFIHRFVGAWTLEFADRVRETTELGFYREVAELLSLFVRSEMKYLSPVVG